MAITYPIDLLTEFPGWASLSLTYGDETSGQAGGQVRVKRLRSPLWMMQAQTKRLKPSEFRAWMAKIESLENGYKTFLGYDFSGKFPILYPNGTWPTGGSFLGTEAAIHTVSSLISLRLKQLPAAYVVSVGDFVAFTDGGSPIGSYSLHQAVETVTADGSGVTSAFEVRPPIRQGAAPDQPVSVKAASCLMAIVPGSVSAPVGLDGWGSISFNAMQVV
ncbi:MAG: hypothetical protein ACK4NE_00130 [Albidovulum sp.]